MKPEPLRRLGKMPVSAFLARHWQRRPACIRGALPGFANPVPRERLFALAADPEVESRLVTSFGEKWKLAHGPFGPRDLPTRRRAGWTLLVQGVDLHDAQAAALASRFRFLPAARFDDVMISFATEGGGVGAHVDQYDVFLLQAHGRRRWRIARRFDPRLREDLPLRVLERFTAEQEWTLDPGDLLYLPPGVAHEGVALGDCLTISIGFRLPARQELAESWYQLQGRSAPLQGHLGDRLRAPTKTPGRLPRSMIDDATRMLHAVAPGRPQARRALLEYLTEPKPSVAIPAPRRPASKSAFARAAARHGVALDLRTRMLYDSADFALNGELLEVVPGPRSAAARALRCLANRKMLTSADLADLPDADAAQLHALLYTWYRSGWLHLAAN